VNAFLDKTQSLTSEARRVICNQATEAPFSGAYNTLSNKGTFLCRRCGIALFRATHQFTAGCGWPSFDDTILNTVATSPDADGQRIEIHCARCQAHLGHVFHGEQFTAKNTRFCVNAVSLDFIENPSVNDSQEALVAGGCFWGVEHFLTALPGVLATEVGYCGGTQLNPSYHNVCQGDSGHYETVRVLFDPAQTNYLKVLQRFFEIHDPTQASGQGPDHGSQYQSAVFYHNVTQQNDAQHLLQALRANGYNTVTQLIPAHPFWPAEQNHQHYYSQHPKTPYCHRPVQRFVVGPSS